MKNYIYHEQQESRLCGQHCLNNLLQGPYFSAVDLAEIAHELDDTERRLGTADNRFRSANVDETGNFSIQVLSLALQRGQGASLVPWFQKRGEADVDVTRQQGIVVNRSEHWFAVRKIGNRWWNLNSTLERPEYISDFALSAFLAGLRADGYQVFLAQGHLPPRGDPALTEHLPRGSGTWHLEEDLFRSFQVKGPGRTDEDNNTNFRAFQGRGNKLGGEGTTTNNKEEAKDLREVLNGDYDEELEIAKAISASLLESETSAAAAAAPAAKKSDDLRAKRLAALSRMGIQ